MGFFSFLTRKPGDRTAERDIKGQAYDSTVASNPPIQGTFPVAGNGPSVLEQLQRAAQKQSDAQIAKHDGFDQGAAPAPGVSRNRNPRPRTAPTNVMKLERPRSFNRSWRMKTGGAPWATPSVHSADMHLPPVPPISVNRASHAASDGLHSPISIDILDAHGEMKPYNFRSRVEAAGVREYGEDVAQRNLPSQLSQQQPFYQLSLATPQGNRPKANTANASYGTFYVDQSDDEERVEELDESAPPPVIARGELSKEERANRVLALKGKKPTTSRNTSFNFNSIKSISMSGKVYQQGQTWIQTAEKRPETHSGGRPSSRLQTPNGPSRRRSLNTLIPQSQSEKQKIRPLSLRTAPSRVSIDTVAPPPIPRSRPGTGASQSHSQSRRLPSSHSNVETRPLAAMVSPREDSRPRTRQSKTAKSDFSGFSSPQSNTSKQSRRASKRASWASSRRASSPDLPLPVFGKPGIEGSGDRDNDAPAPSPQIRKSGAQPEQPQIYTQPDNLMEWQAFYGSARGEHSHPLTHASSMASLGQSSAPRPRSICGASSGSRTRLDNIIEHNIPIRTSSLGVNPQTSSTERATDEAIDCTAPTSTRSKGRSSRRSSVRSNTAVDVFTLLAIEIDQVVAEKDQKADASREPTKVPVVEEPMETRALDNEMRPRFEDLAKVPEGFSDSDSDSFMYGERKQAVDDEGLLFNEGVYTNSEGLPGLFSMFSGQDSPPMLRPGSAASSFEMPSIAITRAPSLQKDSAPTLRHAQSSPGYTKRLSAFGFESSNDDDDDDDDEESLSDFAHALPRGRQIMTLKSFEQHSPKAKRSSMYGLIEEAEAKAAIIQRALSMRKDVETRKRSSTTRSQKSQRSDGDFGEKMREDDDGNMADVES